MKLLHKRLFILFSVALNIGFVIVAIVMMGQHPASRHERSMRAIHDIVEQLELPQDQERAVVETIRRFRITMDRHHQDLKTARSNIVRLLAASGPVDREQLQRLTQIVGSEEKNKNKAFEDHFIDLRTQLGIRKGAQFFSLLLAHIEAEDQTPNP